MGWRNQFNKTSYLYGIAGLASAFAIYYFTPVVADLNQSFVIQEFRQWGVVGTYRRHYERIHQEIERFATADVREKKLLEELALTQKDLEIERSKNTEEEAKKVIRSIASKVESKAGSPVAMTPESIAYQIPDYLLPGQLQTLGLEYFRKKDFEKSAVIFHELLTSKEDHGLSTPENHLIAAISWFKVKNYELSSDYISKTEKMADSKSPVFRQAILWEAILEKTRGNERRSKEALNRLISFYPQTEEASWINRKPSSELKGDQDE